MAFTLLVTASGGALSSLAISQMKASTRHPIRVVAVDSGSRPVAADFADVFEQVPSGALPGYADTILALAKRENVDLVLPWSDEEAVALSARAADFVAAGIALACTDAATLAVLSSKAETFRVLSAAGIEMPDWRMVHSLEELTEVIDEFLARHGEIAVKPVVSRGGRNVFILRPDLKGVVDFNDGRERHVPPDLFLRDMMGDFSNILPVMVMERLFEPAWDIDVLCRAGEMLCGVPRRRINPAGIPFKGGIIEAREDLIELARRVVRALDLSWLYDIDVLADRQGRPKVIEVNPRPSGSLAATIAAGIPLFDDLVSLAKGEAVPERAIPDGRVVRPYTTVRVD